MGDGITGSLESADLAAKKAAASVGALEQSFKDLTSTSLTGGKAFEDTVKGLNGITTAADNITETFKRVGKVVPGLDKVADILARPLEIMTGFAGVSVKVVEGLKDTVGALDAVTQISRTMQGNMFDVAASFGESYAKSKEFSSHILENAPRLASADYGYITLKETNDAIKALGDSGIPFGILSGHVETAAGSFELYAGAVMHARGLGLETTQYVDLLSNAIMKQGLSAEDAMSQMADFGGISQETGLAVSDIAASLQGLSNNFNKLGLSAEFGRPILEGFTKTLSSMGLGIENALGLSTELSSALAGLTTDYSAAYVTFQRGGLDMGAGGGALQAGIDLQARMLEIEKGGGDQSALAQEMTGAMRDTIASFAGGDIVTAQEAAADPALAAQYYTQTKLLGDLYDIQDPQAQARTLDLLDQLDSAIASGDQDTAQLLNQQIQDGIQSKDENLAQLEKLNAEMDGHKAFSDHIATNTKETVRLLSESFSDLLMGPVRAAVEGGELERLDRGITDPGAPARMIDDAAAALSDPKQMMKDLTEAFTAALDKSKGDVGDTIQEVKDQGVAEAISELARQIGKVLEQLGVTDKKKGELRP
jgi:DNA-binding ferritin-like protein